MCPSNLASYAAGRRPKRITFGLRNLARSDGKSATNIPFRFVVSTIASCTAMAMKLHGGPGSMSTLFRSPSNYGEALAPMVPAVQEQRPRALGRDEREYCRFDSIIEVAIVRAP